MKNYVKWNLNILVCIVKVRKVEIMNLQWTNSEQNLSCKIVTKSCKKFILQFFLARFLQDFLYLTRKASFLVQDLQDMCKILQVLQEKYLLNLYISCKTVFTGRYQYLKGAKYVLNRIAQNFDVFDTFQLDHQNLTCHVV